MDSSDRCGIYVLRFADGTAYAGKAGNVVNRFSDHRRDWAKKLPGVPIAQVEFASCPADQLDAAELAVIRQLERTDHLHNKLLTNRPGGHGDIEITRNGEQALRIPVDRAQRPRLSKAPVSDKLRRFVSFSMEPDAGQITDFAAVYLAESMPSPAETAGSMWKPRRIAPDATARNGASAHQAGCKHPTHLHAKRHDLHPCTIRSSNA